MKSRKSINKINPTSIALVVGLVVFLFLGLASHQVSYFGVDLKISQALQSIHSPLFSLAMNIVTEIGDDFNLEIIVIFAMALLYFAGLGVEAIKTVLLTAVGATAGSLIKSLVNRSRPDSSLVLIQETFSDKSFPSLHVLLFTVFFGYMFYLAVTKVKTTWLKYAIAIPSSLLILSIGISRIYLGAHWASDTLGGYLLGFLFLYLAVNINRKTL